MALQVTQIFGIAIFVVVSIYFTDTDDVGI